MKRGGIIINGVIDNDKCVIDNIDGVIKKIDEIIKKRVR